MGYMESNDIISNHGLQKIKQLKKQSLNNKEVLKIIYVILVPFKDGTQNEFKLFLKSRFHFIRFYIFTQTSKFSFLSLHRENRNAQIYAEFVKFLILDYCCVEHSAKASKKPTNLVTAPINFLPEKNKLVVAGVFFPFS